MDRLALLEPSGQRLSGHLTSHGALFKKPVRKGATEWLIAPLVSWLIVPWVLINEGAT